MTTTLRFSATAFAISFSLAISPASGQTTELVSKSTAGVQENLGSFGEHSISADGRFGAFGSQATNLIDGLADGILGVG